MDLTKVPAGFALALAQNELAMTVFSRMGDREKALVLEKARHARSEWEMKQIAYTLANSPM